MDELEKLYQHLDGIQFANITEIYLAVQDYFSDNWEKELSYWEINLCNYIAEKYMATRDFEFDDVWDVVEDEE